MFTPLIVKEPLPDPSTAVIAVFRFARERGALRATEPSGLALAIKSVPLLANCAACRKSLVSLTAPRTISFELPLSVLANWILSLPGT